MVVGPADEKHLVLNLRDLNQFLRKDKFKYEAAMLRYNTLPFLTQTVSNLHGRFNYTYILHVMNYPFYEYIRNNYVIYTVDQHYNYLELFTNIRILSKFRSAVTCKN